MKIKRLGTAGPSQSKKSTAYALAMLGTSFVLIFFSTYLK